MNMNLAELRPVFKNDDNLTKEKYMPVPVLTILWKLQESVVNDQLCVCSLLIYSRHLFAVCLP